MYNLYTSPIINAPLPFCIQNVAIVKDKTRQKQKQTMAKKYGGFSFTGNKIATINIADLT